MIAALFVEVPGVYKDLGLDCWDIGRDARRYRGPHSVIAHPPCKRWGRYWGGGPSAKVKRIKGDDDGCFASALWSARTFGGIVEHPEASHAWSWFGLPRPVNSGGWTERDCYGGASCCVEQGHYGHRARKATWLYSVGGVLAELKWGPSEGVRLDAGFHSVEEREAAKSLGVSRVRDSGRLTPKECISTPREFAELLVLMIGEKNE